MRQINHSIPDKGIYIFIHNYCIEVIRMEIRTTKAQKRELIKNIKRGRIKNNEKVWNYLIAHLISNSDNNKEYINKICGKNVNITKQNQMFWYEPEPLPPRMGEGNTKLDLALGDIKLRDETQLGIEYNHNSKTSWVSFIEGKYLSDCSTIVSNDPLRNQIVRIIENLLCFQANSQFPSELYFTLLTPRKFKENPYTRLYGYKMEEYQDDEKLTRDIKLSNLEKRNQPNKWSYPNNIKNRMKKLKLNWITYEEIIEKELNIPVMDLTNIQPNNLNTITEYLRNKILDE